jgi:ribosomal protein L27
MSGKGGISSKFYRETRGLKVSDGEEVNTGKILTRQGDKWKPGLNVGGRTNLFALCGGKIYFTKKKGTHNKIITIVNIKPAK